VITTEDIKPRVAELARGDSPLEQDVHLGVGASLWLRQTEEDPDDAESAAAGPEEGALGGPAPSVGFGRQLVGGEDVDHDAADVVEVSGEHDGLGLEAGGGHLCDEGVADGTNGEVVDECEEKKHGADCPARGLVGGWCDGGQADDEEKSEENAGTVEVECSSAGAVHQEPRSHGANHAECVLSHRQVK